MSKTNFNCDVNIFIKHLEYHINSCTDSTLPFHMVALQPSYGLFLKMPSIIIIIIIIIITVIITIVNIIIIIVVIVIIIWSATVIWALCQVVIIINSGKGRRPLSVHFQFLLSGKSHSHCWVGFGKKTEFT